MLQADPTTASAEAQCGKVALHLIAPGVTTTALEVAEIVLAANPSGAGTQDRGSQYPYQCAGTKEMQTMLRAGYDARHAA